ncbi:hypothetical protein [Hymenobacter fodinae]|uniref:Uncharacterized protein n=1 Tax=Hymenobacter fodinae TaxID=2510796 RepID=A0A4Z0P0Y1_9BACT|nr:hypothetical protein [Hymenobacter fodinae]TGE03324.1 hypothetical protein EU556_25750 [Hymenobacter fodinae]
MPDPDDLTPESPLHPALENMLGRDGHFDVGANSLDQHIGRRVRFSDADSYRHDPKKPGQIRQYTHEIVGVQYNYEGKLRYRVEVRDPEWPGNPRRDFGRPADPDEVEFVD